MNRKTPNGQPGQAPEGNSGPVDDATVRLAELLMIKPKWRGWIHPIPAPKSV